VPWIRDLTWFRTAVAKVVVMIAGLSELMPAFSHMAFVGNDGRIGLEDGITASGRPDLELAFGDEGNRRLYERHDFLIRIGMMLAKYGEISAAVEVPPGQMAVVESRLDFRSSSMCET